MTPSPHPGLPPSCVAPPPPPPPPPPAPPPPPGVRLDHVVIAVSDWARSNAFYRDVVGAEIVRRGDGYAYRLGDQQLNVHGPGMSPGLRATLRVVPGNSDLCLVWPGTAEEAVAHLAAHGVPVIAGPGPREGGAGTGASVYFRDPDGSLLEFISYLPAG